MERAVRAEDEAKAAKKLVEDAESSHEVMCTRLRTFKEAIKTGSEKLQEELPELLASMGLWLRTSSRMTPILLAWNHFSSGFAPALPWSKPGRTSTRTSVLLSPSVP